MSDRVMAEPSQPEQGAVRHAGRDILYTVRRSSRRRTVSLQVHAHGIVLLVPTHLSRPAVAEVVRRRADWLVRHLDRIAAASPRALEQGALVHVRGIAHRLDLVTDPLRRRASVDRAEGLLRVFVPATTAAEARPAVVRQALTRHMRELALEVLPERVDVFAGMLGRRASRVLVRDPKKRWGSCAADGTIRLNWRLILLPDALSDYVCAHEAAHLAAMDHSPRFWAQVSRVLPDWQARRRRLRDEAGPFLALG